MSFGYHGGKWYVQGEIRFRESEVVRAQENVINAKTQQLQSNLSCSFPFNLHVNDAHIGPRNELRAHNIPKCQDHFGCVEREEKKSLISQNEVLDQTLANQGTRLLHASDARFALRGQDELLFPALGTKYNRTRQLVGNGSNYHALPALRLYLITMIIMRRFTCHYLLFPFVTRHHSRTDRVNTEGWNGRNTLVLCSCFVDCVCEGNFPPDDQRK